MITASDTAFEGDMGYFDCLNGKGNYDAAKVMPNWGEPYAIVQPGVGGQLVIFRIDASAGEHQCTTGKIIALMAHDHENFHAFATIAQQHHGGREARLGYRFDFHGGRRCGLMTAMTARVSRVAMVALVDINTL